MTEDFKPIKILALNIQSGKYFEHSVSCRKCILCDRRRPDGGARGQGFTLLGYSNAKIMYKQGNTNSSTSTKTRASHYCAIQMQIQILLQVTTYKYKCNGKQCNAMANKYYETSTDANTSKNTSTCLCKYK